MKVLTLIILAPILLIAILRAQLTPWRLLSPSEFSAIEARMQVLEQRNHSQISNGSWMRDEKYRTSLEKTTVVGVPEASKRRER